MTIDPMTGEPWKAGNWWHWWGVTWRLIALDYSIRDLAARLSVHVMPDGAKA